ncbi:MAG: sporulation protein YabP [Christensenellales bacterium]|jgi:sporulation protein YabP|nr:sporulation protein YabP [Clostridiales bacterium]
MAREEERRAAPKSAHSIVIQGRERITVAGVLDVDSFNETEIQLVTDLGLVTIVGEQMHISRLNLEDGQMIVEGLFVALEYSDEDVKRRGSLFSRLFG